MKNICILIIFIFFAVPVFACPICGCGVGNFYMGLLPDFKKQFIGIRYQHIPYHTQIAGDEEEFSHDYYNTVELWGGTSLGRKWQLLAFVPYQVNKQNSDDGIKKLNGFGDISVLANYKLLDKIKITGNNRSTEHQLWVGAGLKLPIGKYHIDVNDPETELGDVNSQAGTGSTDFLLNTMYNVRINNFGVNTILNYKINTANKDDYHFGNRFNASSFAYYQFKLKNAMLAPNAGILYQHSGVNHFNSTKVEETGGYLAMAVAGAELGFGQVTFGANVQLPFSQNFAHGQTEAQPRAMAHISFSF